jgi:hypothetical protein
LRPFQYEVRIVALIDDRGRLFGRVNLIDALVGVVVLGLIPLAYGAIVLFGVPVPKVTSITPARVTAGQAVTVEVIGADLRPFLTATFGTVPARGFLVQSPTRAEVHLPDLPPGTYDLVLWDVSKKILTVPAVLAVVPPAVAAANPVVAANAEVQVRGAFVGPTADQARALTPGAALDAQAGAPPLAIVVAVRAPVPMLERVKVGPDAFFTMPSPAGIVRVAAVVRLRCALSNGECKARGTLVEQGATLQLSGPAGVGPMSFAVDDVRPADSPISFPPTSPAIAVIQVRFVVGLELLAVMKPGDRDVAGQGVVADADRAVLTAVGSDPQDINVPVSTEGALRSFIVQQPALLVGGSVRVPVVYTPQGWTYKDRRVKVGAPFSFETVEGAMAGWILEMKIGPAR